ncbi:MAG: hypothetical protein N2110_03795 [Flavobacteriales bacterium]|nr:hypothetical protein [Flavobacteriales bacterium]
MARRLSLDLSLDEYPLALGIVSALPEYTLAFRLDKVLHTRLTLRGYYIAYNRRFKTFHKYLQYEYNHEEVFRFYRLVSNRSEDASLLLDDYGPLDYIFLVFGEISTGDVIHLKERLRGCQGVEFVLEVYLDEKEHHELLVR